MSWHEINACFASAGEAFWRNGRGNLGSMVFRIAWENFGFEDGPREWSPGSKSRTNGPSYEFMLPPWGLSVLQV